MVTEQSFSNDSFVKLIECAQFALGSTEASIKNKFSTHKIVRFVDTISDEIILEMHFDIGTLTCLINNEPKKGVCHEATLFLNSLDHLEQYVELCGKLYKQTKTNTWIKDSIQIKLVNHLLDSIFVISKI